jgi:hypothetical protein
MSAAATFWRHIEQVRYKSQTILLRDLLVSVEGHGGEWSKRFANGYGKRDKIL